MYSIKNYLLTITTATAVFLFLFSSFPSTASAATVNISTCAGLQNISSGLNSDYVLTGDIDCSGVSYFNPIGTFRGTLDGQGHSITGLHVPGTLFENQRALFSYTDGALIENVSIPGATITGYFEPAVLVSHASNTVILNVSVGGTVFTNKPGGGNAGGIAGTISNTIIAYSSSSVAVSGWSYMGGLVGVSTNGSIIKNSYSTGQVGAALDNDSEEGGLVGVNDSSTISNSYSSSQIYGTNNTGGLVGKNTGATAVIDKSYAVGNINTAFGTTGDGGLVGVQVNSATTTDSYWDTSTTSQGSSAGGTGKNTSQMQTQGTFTNWDFVNVWSISASQYPALRAGDTTAPATPTAFTAVATGSNVHLAWTNPVDGDFAGVDVLQSLTYSPSNQLVGAALITGTTDTSADDIGIADGTYNYAIIASDTSGNYSIPARATVRVDTTPPGAPTSVSAHSTTSTIALSWTNPLDSDFASVTIRRSTTGYPTSVTDGSAVAAGLTGTTYSDTGLADGTYYYSLFALDGTGLISVVSQVSAIVDTVVPVLSEVTPVPSETNDTTPSYSFSTTKAGTISYGGSCASATTSATVGTNTITFNTLAQGTYSNCTITVTDVYSNISTALSIGTFTIDTLAPVLVAGTPVATQTTAANAYYSFTTTETGTYSLTGCIGSIDSSAHVVRFNGLAPGTYSCLLSVLDAAGNVSNTLSIGPFTIYRNQTGHVVPVISVTSLDAALTVNTGAVTHTEDGYNVPLIFNADPNTVQGYAASLDPKFSDTGIYPYQSNVSFLLPNKEGTYTIYIKFFSVTGKGTDVFKKVVTVGGGSAKGTSSVVSPTAVPAIMLTNKTLRHGVIGPDVRALQQFLNTHGFTVSTTGAGSIGNETTYFGPATKAAVIQYQKARGITPSIGIVGVLTHASIEHDLAQN